MQIQNREVSILIVRRFNSLKICFTLSLNWSNINIDILFPSLVR